MDYNEIMKNAMSMRDQLDKTGEQLRAMEFVGTAGGGAVKIKMTGDLEVTSVTIDPDVVDPDDIGMTEDLLVVAFNDAIDKYNKSSMQQISSLDLGGFSSMLGL